MTPNRTLKLSKAQIAAIKAPDPSGQQVLYWDTELKGFGILASGKTTAKSYIVQRRPRGGGSPRRQTVGAVGEFAKVEDARKKAASMLAALREGRDPKVERRIAASRDRTLRQWLDAYLIARKDLRERSVEEYRRSADLHLSAWLDRPLREINPEMVEAKHAQIGEDAGPAAANSAMRALRAIWNFALDRDETLRANPVRRLKRAWFVTPSRTRMVSMDELPKFYPALEVLPNRTAADYLRLLLFTGLRRREAASLRWSDVDFKTRVIRLPASRTKAGRKLDLPMSSFVRELLVARRALGDDGGFVFGANSKSGHIEEPKFALAMVAKATGVAISVHDLRRTFVTIAESADISPLALKALVNHALGSDVTAGYVQMTAERLREPAQRVCEKIMELCGIAAPEGVAQIGDRA